MRVGTERPFNQCLLDVMHSMTYFCPAIPCRARGGFEETSSEIVAVVTDVGLAEALLLHRHKRQLSLFSIPSRIG